CRLLSTIVYPGFSYCARCTMSTAKPSFGLRTNFPMDLRFSYFRNILPSSTYNPFARPSQSLNFLQALQVRSSGAFIFFLELVYGTANSFFLLAPLLKVLKLPNTIETNAFFPVPSNLTEGL